MYPQTMLTKNVHNFVLQV
uniref:Uncharacterized protein n=1 Tax=Anguilla anguilla TaxID=7936 RepID=A0A0E9RNX4_ANGAN